MTHQQARLLSYIHACLAVSDVSPSYAEMAAHMGIAKPRIHYLVAALRDAGHINMLKGRHRSISLPPRATPHLSAISEGLRQIAGTTSLATAQATAAALLEKIEGAA